MEEDTISQTNITQCLPHEWGAFFHYYGDLICMIAFLMAVLAFAFWMRKRAMKHYDASLQKSHQNQQIMIDLLREISNKLSK